MKTRKIIVLGTGGNCIDIFDTLNDINKVNDEKIYECAGFLDDDANKIGQKFNGIEVVGTLADAVNFEDCFFVNGIGNPENFWKKQEIIGKTKIKNDKFLSIIHPTASVSEMSSIGKGTVVFQNVTITSNSRIGDHVVVLPNSIISHDVIISDYASIAGGVCVSGGVEIGESCYLGTNSTIKGNLKIGKNSLVGMGSVVLRNVEENVVVAGNPAKFLRNVR